MSYRVILHKAAEKEYLSSYLWYEERSKGLGERFSQAIDAVFIHVANNPLQFPEKLKNYREAITEVFPFLIVYKIYPKKKEILVVYKEIRII